MPSDTEPEIDWDSLTFSFTQTDRMYMAKCEIGGEWERGAMKDYEDLVISPAAGVLNYGQGLFEGLKAQRASLDLGSLSFFGVHFADPLIQ